MKEKNPVSGERLSELRARAKDGLAKFEELRGFL